MRKVSRMAAFAAVGVAALAPVPGLAQRTDDDWLEDCRDDSDRGRQVAFCEVRVADASLGSGPIRVDPGPNGGVSVVGWDENRVEVHARVVARARTEEDAADLAEEVRVSLDGVIEADGPRSDRRSNWSVSFVVYAPADSDAEIEALNGPLSVTGVSGRMRLDAENGPILLRDVGGDVVARTRNGPLTVELSGTQWEGAGLDAETVNGPVTLTLPDDFNANLETGTANGPFTSDLPITMTIRGRLGRPFTGTLGQGGPPIRVVTVNGPVRIRES
ncbi:MAG: DUF4097 family beta strand repeat-containing protein [Gemmatimonadales bacterium]